MNDFMITTDNMADLPDEYLKENNLKIMSLSYMLEGETYSEDHPLPVKEFYAKMRGGAMPTTSQVNPDEAKKVFEELLKSGRNILHIAFSSGLSGSCNSARIAAEEINERGGGQRVVVVDSLCASLGEGLLVHKALQLKKAGKSLDEIAQWLTDNRLRLCHNFTVDDLNHLYRGGRVSKATAVVGTMINIKPILHVDNEGKLVAIGKVRGRKKSLVTLVDNMEKQMGSYKDQNDIVFISHGDCVEDARFVADQVKERFGIESFLINYVGPTIGAHSGPGTIALFFMGEYR